MQEIVFRQGMFGQSGKGRAVAALLAIALAFALPGAAPANASDKTLRAVVHADLKIIDPLATTAYITNRFGFLIYDTLFGYNSQFEPKPQMVDTYTVSDDKLTWSFTLRDGLKWHDGSPVTAEDCVASLKRWMGRNQVGQRLAQFTATLEAADAKTFRLVLKEPYGLVLDSLSVPTQPPFMMPKAVAATPPMEQIKTTIGSGPFMFKTDEWVPGNKVVFVKNPSYVPRSEAPDYMSGAKVVKLDRVEWLYIPDNNTTLSALTAGEIDYFESPPLDFIALLKANSDITVLNIDNLGYQGLIRPNSSQPPFDNIKARQALAHLVSQEEYMGAVVGNPDLYLKYCGAFFLCGSANESKAGYAGYVKPDIEKAKQLFKEAGYKGEKLVVLQPTDRPQYSAAMLVTIQNLRKAGINVDVRSADWSTILTLRSKKDPIDKGGWNIFISSHGGVDVANPIANVWFGSKCDKANVGWPCDPDLEALMDQWTRETDAAKQHALIDKIQARAYESLPYIPFGQYFQPIAFRNNIKGVVAAGMPVYWNIEKTD